jgi:DNA modification methylase
MVHVTGDTFELIKELLPKSMDLVIADPPYDLNEFDKSFLQEQFLRVCRGRVIVFSPPENQWILPADQYLFWIKPISTKNTSKSYSRYVEMIFVYGSGTWNSNRHWSQYTNVFTDLVDVSIHPHRKPPSLIERLILNHTNVGDVILDPFAGSRVVDTVAQRLGRKCISFEKEMWIGYE